jgi:hypothetical protein
VTRVSIRSALKRSKPKCQRPGCGHGAGSHGKTYCGGRDGCPCTGFIAAVERNEMTRLSDLKPEYREVMAVQAIIEQGFGIPKADLFVAHSRAPAGFCIQVLARQDGRKYTVDVAVVETDGPTFAREWVAAVTAYNASTQPERVELMERSRARRRAVELLASMSCAGFSPRAAAKATS